MRTKNRRLWLANRLSALMPRPTLEAGALLDASAKREGLSDFGDPPFEVGLDSLLRALTQDAALSPMGRAALHQMLVRNLANRLRLVEDRKRRPAVYARPLTPPIMILGMPRTGTTFLHRLLSVMPGARKARSWELIQPLPPRRAADERRTQAARQVALARTLAPELDSKHRLGVDEPDECVLLMAPSFHSIAWWMFAPTYGYLDWLLDQDLAPAYAEYHLYLRALQDAEGGRFVLKAPAHTGYLAELAAEIPELVFVQTHRDPATVLASASSLFDSFFSLVTEHHDSQRTARTNLELFLSLDQRCRAARDAGLDDRVLDLRYETIIADPIAAVRQIYAHGDIPWPEGGEAVLRAHLQASGQRRRPKHRYALEDFGLSTDEVHQRFAAYIARYLGSCARQRT